LSTEDWVEVGFPFVLALQLVFSVLQLLDYFDVVYYVMIHRITETQVFDLGFSLVIPLLLLAFFWGFYVYRVKVRYLVFFLGFIFLFFFNYTFVVSLISIIFFIFGLFIVSDRWKIISAMLSISIVYYGVCLVHLIIVILGFSTPFVAFASLEMALWGVSEYLIPFLLFPFFFVWVFKPLINYGLGWQFKSPENFDLPLTHHEKGILLFSLLLSILIAIVPYLPSINPTSVSVGVDYYAYVEALNNIIDGTCSIYDAFEGSRPLMFLILLFFKNIFHISTSNLVKFLPVVLNPFYILSSYFMGLQITSKKHHASWLALFSIFGHHLTINMYAYYISNLFALSLLFVSIGLLIKGFKCDGILYALFGGIIGGSVLFIHPWSYWEYFILIIFLSIVYIGNNREKKNMIVIYLFVFSLFTIFNMFFVNLYSNTAKAVISNISDLSFFWSENIFSIFYRYGGVFSNLSIILCLLLCVFFLKPNNEDFMNPYLINILLSFPFLIGNESLKSRILYNLPIQFYLLHGMIYLYNKNGADTNHLLFLCFILIFFVNLFRFLINLI